MAPLDAYNIRQCVSKGTQHSRVYQATHKDTGTVVAIKRIQIYDMHPTVRKEYETEVGLLQSLEHPNLIKYHEHFNQDNDLYLVMELASGGHLAQTIENGRRTNARIEESLIWRWLYDVAGALAYMHTRMVLHRDVKPSHIYLGENGQAKLGNFGLSKTLASQAQAFSCVGTPFYMSPEIVKGEGYSFASDVWSLGCSIYEVCTCYPPFHRADNDFYALGEAITTARYPALSPYEWSKELIDLLAEILVTNPAQRPSAQRLLDVAACKLVGKVQDFEILGTIGKGKFSEVHRSRWKAGGDKEVALKRVQIFEMQTESRKECVTEVNLLKSLNHCTIVKYLDSFVDNNELVIVLELASHGDLANLFREHKRLHQTLTELQIWSFFFQVCDALYYMHTRRIMHRDIKPANMFLCSGGIVKLGDLGLGRYFSSNTYRAYSVVGTPFYMSPEVITNAEGYSFKSDIWSLGCVLYELSILTSPFATNRLNYYVLGNRIRSAEYPPLPEGVGQPVRSLCSDMIQVTADARPDIHGVFVRANEHFTNCPMSECEAKCLAGVQETQNATLHRQLTRAAAVVKEVIERDHSSKSLVSNSVEMTSLQLSAMDAADLGYDQSQAQSQRGRSRAKDSADPHTKRPSSRTKRKTSQQEDASSQPQDSLQLGPYAGSVGHQSVRERRNTSKDGRTRKTAYGGESLDSRSRDNRSNGANDMLQGGGSLAFNASSRKTQTPPYNPSISNSSSALLPQLGNSSGVLSEGWKPLPSLGLPPLAPPRDPPREAFTERSAPSSRELVHGTVPPKAIMSARGSVTPPCAGSSSTNVSSMGVARMRSHQAILQTGAVVAGEELGSLPKARTPPLSHAAGRNLSPGRGLTGDHPVGGTM